MTLNSKRAIGAALATMAIVLTGSLFAAGSASAAQTAKATVAPAHVTPDPVVIVDR